MEKIGAANFKI